MVSMPGALTPSEIQTAHRAGADFVKIFPITTMGPKYLKAVKAPLSHVKLLAVGGIDENNAAEYIKAGAAGLGVGGKLVNSSYIENGEFDKLTETAKKLVSAVNNI